LLKQSNGSLADKLTDLGTVPKVSNGRKAVFASLELEWLADSGIMAPQSPMITTKARFMPSQ
jgi:hypothetical protein